MDVEARISEIIRDANKHNDNDWWPEAEEIATNAVATALADDRLINRIKKQTFYYIYIDGDEYFITKTPPIFDKEKRWHHPEYKNRCTLSPLWIDDHEKLEQITEFNGISIKPWGNKGIY